MGKDDTLTGKVKTILSESLFPLLKNNISNIYIHKTDFRRNRKYKCTSNHKRIKSLV